MSDNVKPLAEVVESIPSGAHTAPGGVAFARNTIAVDHELGRQQKRDLTVSQGVVGLETDLLVGIGLVSHLIMGGCSLDRFGLAHMVSRARKTHSLLCDDYSGLSMSFRYLAGALGISLYSHQVSAGIRDSGLARGGAGAGNVQRMKRPLTGEGAVLKALTPDFSMVNVRVTDREGICHMNGPRWENEEQVWPESDRRHRRDCIHRVHSTGAGNG